MYCGRKLGIRDMHADQKIPGAGYHEGNVQLLCVTCNTRKGSMTDGEFRRAYASVGLLPARQAKGRPPSKVIPLSKFDEVSGFISKRRAKRRTKDRDPFGKYFYGY